jgi:hypothetical protein
MRNTSNVVEKIKTHIPCSILPPLPESHAICGIMWKRMVKPDRPDMKTQYVAQKHAIRMLDN